MPLVAGDFNSAREAAISELQSMKKAEPGKDSWITSTSSKLSALNLALPASDASFKAAIQKGLEALGEIQNQENDTQILKLFVLASSFADYYRSHKDTPSFIKNQALSTAVKAFECGEGNNPLAYFPEELQSILFSYRHYYPQFNEPIPQHILACQIEYLGAAYDRSEPDGIDDEAVFAVAAQWDAAFAKLKTLPPTSRNAAIKTIAQALDSGDIGDKQTEAVARQHLNEVKAFFEKTP
jgi:hypothetical protein